MQLTGDQIRQALEQQWQPRRRRRAPFLRLGVSKGFKYTYDPPPSPAPGSQDMWLNGNPIGPNETFSVTVNSFLATGGDNFAAFNTGTDKRDTGQVDLQAMVDYMDGVRQHRRRPARLRPARRRRHVPGARAGDVRPG